MFQGCRSEAEVLQTVFKPKPTFCNGQWMFMARPLLMVTFGAPEPIPDDANITQSYVEISGLSEKKVLRVITGRRVTLPTKKGLPLFLNTPKS